MKDKISTELRTISYLVRNIIDTLEAERKTEQQNSYAIQTISDIADRLLVLSVQRQEVIDHRYQV